MVNQEPRRHRCPRCKDLYVVATGTSDFGGSVGFHVCSDGTICVTNDTPPKENKKMKLRDNDFIKSKMKRNNLCIF